MSTKEIKTRQMTQRYPVLLKVSEEKRLPIIKKSQKNPVLWIVFLALMVMWIYFFGGTIIAVSENHSSILNLLYRLIIPAFIPALVIFTSLFWVQKFIITKLVKKELSQIL